MTKAIIYYTSNKEDPKFENRIIETLLKNSGGLPIISVSQKPIKLGRNICVGDIGASGFNMFRQVQIALQHTDADYVISAEADCCYPPDYFQFNPTMENIAFRNNNLYVMGDHRAYWYHKKEGATHAQIVGRKFYLDTLNKLFKGAPQWSLKEFNFPKERHRKEDVFDNVKFWHGKNPVFQIKTHRSMRYYTNSDRKPTYDLPYWGNGKDVRTHYMSGVKEIYERIQHN